MASLRRMFLVSVGAAAIAVGGSAPAMAQSAAPTGERVIVVEHMLATVKVNADAVESVTGPEVLDMLTTDVGLGEATAPQPSADAGQRRTQMRDQPKHHVRKCAAGLAWDRKHLTCTYAGLVQE